MEAPLINVLIPVIVASVSVIGAVFIWVLNQHSARTAATREAKKELYENMVTGLFSLCGMNETARGHRNSIFVLDTAWLFASRGVLQAILNFLKRYKEIRDGGDPGHFPRDDKCLERLLHNVYAEMRKDLISKPWYTFGFREFPPIRGRIEFYEWTQHSYAGLRANHQIEPDKYPPDHEPEENEGTG